MELNASATLSRTGLLPPPLIDKAS